jgi:hypothetical protein
MSGTAWPGRQSRRQTHSFSRLLCIWGIESANAEYRTTSSSSESALLSKLLLLAPIRTTIPLTQLSNTTVHPPIHPLSSTHAKRYPMFNRAAPQTSIQYQDPPLSPVPNARCKQASTNQPTVRLSPDRASSELAKLTTGYTLVCLFTYPGNPFSNACFRQH